MTSLPVPRETIQEIVDRRNRAVSLFAGAHAALADAYDRLGQAFAALPGRPGSTSYDLNGDRQAAALLPVVQVPAAPDFLAAAQLVTDRRVWGHLVTVTDLERLMDKTAKDGLRQQLHREPPEVTVGNVEATLEQFVLDADTIFKRGLATVFSALDRRFRSHDGWKIGGRVILDGALSLDGYWSHYRNQRDALQDIERVFHVLDSKPMPLSYAGIVGAVEQSRHGAFGARQSEAESDYFTARCFKNGNLHLWFKRDDLLERVNRLLGDYYGAPIPEDRDADADDGLHAPKTTLAKNYGFFPTPDAAADRLIEEAQFGWRRKDEAPLTVLEPSAGTGNLARRCVEAGALVDCVEVHAERAGVLAAAKRYRRVIAADFLALQPGPELYDRIVMNPPFDRERDIDHVHHAMRFLKPDGRLAAIMSAGTEFRDTKKARAFRDIVAAKKGRWRDLPAGSFAEAGTACNTVVVTFRNDGRESWA